MLKKYNVMRWAGLIWVRVWIIFQLLRREQWSFGVHKSRYFLISWAISVFWRIFYFMQLLTDIVQKQACPLSHSESAGFRNVTGSVFHFRISTVPPWNSWHSYCVQATLLAFLSHLLYLLHDLGQHYRYMLAMICHKM
jgi:hypothetical protein